MTSQFNIRVYGILINNQQQVLVTDEKIRGMLITKFPGGGLEHGEGTRDCLKREFLEEMNLPVKVMDHIYTTDFYQQSAFNPAHHIISIYYYVSPIEAIKVRLNDHPFDFDETQLKAYDEKRETESFRFINWNQLTEDSVTLPIDKRVVKLIKENSQTL
jgi:ADP-ribose pyrophosphatase YjhB (NUDIX family)